MKPDWLKISSVALNVFLLCFLLRACEIARDCDASKPSITTLTFRDSTAYIHDTIYTIQAHAPKVITIKEYVSNPTVKIDTQIVLQQCLDTVIFSNKFFEPENYKLTINDTVTGNKIIGSGITIANLKPEHWRVETITKTIEKKQSLVKVYAGIWGQANMKATLGQGWELGAKAVFIFDDRHAVGVNYGAVRQTFGIEFLEKIRLKK